MTNPLCLSISTLRKRYSANTLSPLQLIDELWPRLSADDEKRVWIQRLDRDALLSYAKALEDLDPTSLPLYGVPFAIKDNIDLAGIPTTAACREFAYTPVRHSSVVERLIGAGAIPLGKTNLDQFATGLVGTRSAYGACRNSFDANYISGGSSAGSAVAVAAGLASFSLGTDTAGSGRVPAAFNNLIGLKPTCGLLSTAGTVPACRSLDVISIFSTTAEDAERVLAVAAAHDSADPFSRPAEAYGFDFGRASTIRVGIPSKKDLEFFGNTEYERLFHETVAGMGAMGAEFTEIDLTAFLDAARLLYEGPWVAERYAAIRAFFDRHGSALHPITREIIGKSKDWLAADAYEASYHLRSLRREALEKLRDIDCVMTPTAGTIYRVDEVEADPIRLNSNLGFYTNFMNLLDFAAVSVPAGFMSNGLPFGVTLFSRAHTDVPLLHLAGRLQRLRAKTIGATGLPIPMDTDAVDTPSRSGQLRITVCGAHMAGMPLSPELTERGARFIERTKTVAAYELYALPGEPPQRPGLIRRSDGGAEIEVEVWEIASTELGDFLSGLPAPLALGTLELADGSSAAGIVCESHALDGATNITEYAGWRSYVSRLKPDP